MNDEIVSVSMPWLSDIVQALIEHATPSYGPEDNSYVQCRYCLCATKFNEVSGGLDHEFRLHANAKYLPQLTQGVNGAVHSQSCIVVSAANGLSNVNSQIVKEFPSKRKLNPGQIAVVNNWEHIVTRMLYLCMELGIDTFPVIGKSDVPNSRAYWVIHDSVKGTRWFKDEDDCDIDDPGSVSLAASLLRKEDVSAITLPMNLYFTPDLNNTEEIEFMGRVEFQLKRWIDRRKVAKEKAQRKAEFIATLTPEQRDLLGL
jgi:hypothetical protein